MARARWFARIWSMARTPTRGGKSEGTHIPSRRFTSRRGRASTDPYDHSSRTIGKRKHRKEKGREGEEGREREEWQQ